MPAGRTTIDEPAQSVLHRADAHSSGARGTARQRFATPEPYAEVIEVEFETVSPISVRPDVALPVTEAPPAANGFGHASPRKDDPLQPPPPDIEAIAAALAAEMDRNAARNGRRMAEAPREETAATVERPVAPEIFASIPEREPAAATAPQTAAPAPLDLSTQGIGLSIQEAIARGERPERRPAAPLLANVLPPEATAPAESIPPAESLRQETTSPNEPVQDIAPHQDAAFRETASQDAAFPDTALQNGASPDAAFPDTAFQNGASPDTAFLDGASPDAAIPDTALRDGASPDVAFQSSASPDAAFQDGASRKAAVREVAPQEKLAQKAAAHFARAKAQISPLARQAAHFARTKAAPAAIKAGLWIAHNLRRKEIRRRYGEALSLVHSRVLDRRLEQHFFVPTLKSQRFSPDPERGILYEGPVPAAAFNWALSAMPEDLREYAFVDFRAGLGRAMLLASQRKFERILGYEYAAAPYDDLQMNIAQFPRSKMACRDIQCFRGDRAGVSIPDQPCVLYFANAWREEFLTGIMTYLGESYRHRPRRLYVILENVDELVVLPKGDIFYRLELPLAEKLKLRLLSPMDFQVYRTLV